MTTELIRLEGVPVYQNKMFGSREAALQCPRGDVVLARHPASGHVANLAFDPGLLVYDRSYQNEQGLSSVFKAHLDQVLGIIDRHFASMQILEIGCGKGGFLDQMRAAGHNARGVDPAYEGDAAYIIPEPFEAELGVRGDAIVMRHVLEHIPAPADFLARISAANGGAGLVYIEVPCLDWILRNRAWFDFFYEHVNYFRRADFDRMFGRVLNSGTLFGGQYLYVVADLASLRGTDGPAQADVAPALFPADFFASLDRCAGMARTGVPSVVWGAAAKGVMFSHHMQARGVPIALAIDINPAKQGHWLAGSGLPVFAPADALAQLGSALDVFVMNSNYLPEIRAIAGPGPNFIAVDHS